jgi:protein-L-isoaspartate(D-aspartate) O-methyltransferase
MAAIQERQLEAGVESRTTQARERMLREQIEARGVADLRVLAALRAVPRHELVPEAQRDYAYEDRPLSIGHGQTISQPYIVALMSEALELDEDERVLEIGTGSGYQAAVLGELAREVYSIEIVAPLAERAKLDLAPIVVTAAPEHVPQALVDQLAVGGRLVIPVGRRVQELLRITRDEQGVREERLLGVRFVPMTGEAQEQGEN